MKLLEKIIKDIVLEESVSLEDISNSIDNHNRVIINYHSKGKDKNSGARVIEVYAYGLTKAGNPVIRAFQPYGDTTSRVPSWKFFRVDRISSWKNTNQNFSKPADFYYKGLGKFNNKGDNTMSVVYKIAKFGDKDNNSNKPTEAPVSHPKTKSEAGETFKTDTEHRMERMRQQMDNPITLSDIKTINAFKDLPDEAPQTTGPKTKEDAGVETFKTETERRMERLRQQMQNPRTIDLSKFERKNTDDTKEDDKASEIEDLEKQLSTDEPITLGDLNKKLKKRNEEEPFKTETERRMERLRQQMQNPRTIDLSKIPRR